MISDNQLNFIIGNFSTPILQAFIELKTRRESELIPANKFVNCLLEEQVAKLEEELEEIKEVAAENENGGYNVKRLAEEIIDLQMACETLLAHIGLTKEQRLYARKMVIDKNRQRGYYDGEA